MLSKSFTYIILVSVLCNVQAQELIFSDPVKMGSSVNSASEELNPTLSPDGQTLYFARAFHRENTGGTYAGMDIWMSKRTEENTWTKATNKLGAINNKENNVVVGIRSDNKVLYLLNSYSNKNGIAFAETRYDGWSGAEMIYVPGLNRNDFLGFYMSPSYDVLLISMRGEMSYGKEDLYVSLKNSSGEWAKPINLGSTINTSGFEISPFLSDDKKRLYFASNGHRGFGDADIFVSERLYNSWTVWSAPKNIGEKINSQAFDAYFTIAKDSTVIFASNRGGELSDLYQSSYLGNEKNARLALKESLVKEAKGILAELRGDNHEKEYFIEFEEDSAAMSEAGKRKLSSMVKELNYQHYGEIKLVTFDEKNDAIIHSKRVKNIVDYLKISGINEDKITVSNTKKMTSDVASALFQKAHGVLIIISKTN